MRGEASSIFNTFFVLNLITECEQLTSQGLRNVRREGLITGSLGFYSVKVLQSKQSKEVLLQYSQTGKRHRNRKVDE